MFRTTMQRYSRILKNIVNRIGVCADYLHRAGWAEATAGNISVNVTGILKRTDRKNEHWFLVTRSGCRFRETAQRPWDDILLIRIGFSKDLKVKYAGSKNACPTSELPAHLLIHDLFQKRKKPIQAVIHAHPSNIIALTHLKDYQDEDTINRLLVSIHPEMKMFIPEGVGFVPFHNPGSDSIAQATARAMMGHRVVIWEKHGCIAAAQDLEQALDLITIIDKSAGLFFIARSAGHDLEGLNQRQIDKLTGMNQ